MVTGIVADPGAAYRAVGPAAHPELCND